MTTLEDINLTKDQEIMMVAAIADINEASTTIRALVRWQKWFRRIYDSGYAAGIQSTKTATTDKVRLHL